MMASPASRPAARCRAVAAAALAAALGLGAAPAGAGALQLVMAEQAGCAWCVRWHREVGDAYALTEQGRRAPLRRVDLRAPWPEDLKAASRPRVTPTFLLTDDGREFGRIEGYPGEDFFWPMLDRLLARAPLGADAAR